MTNEEMQIVLDQMGKKAKRAAIALAILPDDAKRGCLEAMASAIEADAVAIKSANDIDVKLAIENGLAPAMVDRLTLTDARIAGMADGMRTVAAQSDPVGKVISKTVRPNGLEISKVHIFRRLCIDEVFSICVLWIWFFVASCCQKSQCREE